MHRCQILCICRLKDAIPKAKAFGQRQPDHHAQAFKNRVPLDPSAGDQAVAVGTIVLFKDRPRLCRIPDRGIALLGHPFLNILNILKNNHANTVPDLLAMTQIWRCP